MCNDRSMLLGKAELGILEAKKRGQIRNHSVQHHVLSSTISPCFSLTQYGANEPYQAVELIRQAHLKQHRGHVGCFHGIAKFNAKQDTSIEEQLGESTSWRKLTEVQLIQGTGCVWWWWRRGPNQLPTLWLSFEVVGTMTEVPRGGCWEAGGFGE